MSGRRGASNVLPARAVDALAASLNAARGYASHIWRDTAALNPDGTVNAYIEIAAAISSNGNST